MEPVIGNRMLAAAPGLHELGLDEHVEDAALVDNSGSRDTSAVDGEFDRLMLGPRPIKIRRCCMQDPPRLGGDRAA
jgi:hypothetical protein